MRMIKRSKMGREQKEKYVESDKDKAVILLCFFFVFFGFSVLIAIYTLSLYSCFR